MKQILIKTENILTKVSDKNEHNVLRKYLNETLLNLH